MAKKKESPITLKKTETLKMTIKGVTLVNGKFYVEGEERDLSSILSAFTCKDFEIGVTEKVEEELDAEEIAERLALEETFEVELEVEIEEPEETE